MKTENKAVLASKEYEEKFFEVIERYCKKNGEGVKRKLTQAIVAAHQTGQDLGPTLEAKGMKDLSDLLQKFQKDWRNEHKDRSYSMLVWANVQNLFEPMAQKFFNHGNGSK